MKKSYLLLSLLFFTTLAFAQKKKDSLNLHQYKNEIGLDVQGVLEKRLVNGIIYKRKMKDKEFENKNRLRYWRFGGSFFGEISSVEDTLIEVNDRRIYATGKPNHRLSFFVGREWLNHKWDRFSLYYGGDLFFRYVQTTQTASNALNTNIYIYQIDYSVRIKSGDQFLYQELALGIAPFFGAKIHFTDRFFLALEAQFDLFYAHYNVEIESTKKSLSEFDGLKTSTNRFSYVFDHINMITLGFAF